MKSFAKSEAYFNQSKQIAPGGVHSPVRAFRAVGGTPIFFEKGKGSQIWDVDGNQYVDFCMSWGALSIGHAHKDVVDAVQKQAALGTHYGTPTPLDVRLANFALEKLRPFEKIRFVSSGTEAVMTAIRLARGFTGRNKILKVEGSYHGHVDSLLVSAGSGLITFGESFSQGVPPGVVQDTLTIPCHSIDALNEAFSKYGDQIAALILEPVMANNGLFEFESAFLNTAKELTKKHKSLLIFDEVITGFRVGWAGAKELYGVQPDIGTYGKVLGGGLPVGAISATTNIMETLAPNGKVYQAGTLSGNPIAMAAGLATLSRMDQDDYFNFIEKRGQYLDAKIEKLLADRGSLPLFYRRVKGMFWLCPGNRRFLKSPEQITDQHKEAFKKIHRPLLERGIYLSPSVYEVSFISSAHSEQDLDLLVEGLLAIESFL